MDPLKSSQPSSDNSVSELRESLRGLRTLFHVAVIASIVLSGSLSVYLMKQVGIVRRQADDMDAFVNDYEKNTKPRLEAFVNELSQFAKTNPDFAPILGKYLQASGPPAGAAPPPPPGAPGKP